MNLVLSNTDCVMSTLKSRGKMEQEQKGTWKEVIAQL